MPMGMIWKSDETERNVAALYALARSMVRFTAKELTEAALEIVAREPSHDLGLCKLDTEIVRARLQRWRDSERLVRRERIPGAQGNRLRYVMVLSRQRAPQSSDSARAEYERVRACYEALIAAGSASVRELLAATGERWAAAHGLTAEAVSYARMVVRLTNWEKKGLVRILEGCEGYGKKRFVATKSAYPTYEETQARINEERKTRRAKKPSAVLARSTQQARAATWVRGLMA